MCFFLLQQMIAQLQRIDVMVQRQVILWGTAGISLMENPYVIIESIDNVRNTHQLAVNRVRRVGNLGNADRFKNQPVKDEIWIAFNEDIAAVYSAEKLQLSPSYLNALQSYVHLNHLF